MARKLKRTILKDPSNNIDIYRVADNLSRLLNLNGVEVIHEGDPDDCSYRFSQGWDDEEVPHQLDDCYTFRKIPFDKVDMELSILVRAHYFLLHNYLKLNELDAKEG